MKILNCILLLFPILLSAANNISVPIVSVVDTKTSNAVSVQNKTNPEEQPYCPPVVAASAIIEVYEGKIFKGIIVIDRWNPPFGKALPGGKFEKEDDSIEDTVRREMKEELNINLRNLRQFHVYSSRERDPRFRCIDIVFLAETDNLPKAGDDAAKSWVVSIEELSKMKLVFDHPDIVKDYLKYRNDSANNGDKETKILLPQIK